MGGGLKGTRPGLRQGGNMSGGTEDRWPLNTGDQALAPGRGWGRQELAASPGGST